MSERLSLYLLLVVVLLLALTLWLTAPQRVVVREPENGSRLPIHTPTATATPGWWDNLPTPAPWPKDAPTPTVEKES